MVLVYCLGPTRRLMKVMVRWMPPLFPLQLLTLKTKGPHNAESFPHDRLSNNAVAHAPLRKSIFSRVRAPVKPDDPANIFTRNEQAYEYYMPRLGGNSGKFKMTSLYTSFLDILVLGDNPEDMGNQNHRDRWASLTELQYDRLAKWAQGNFNSGRRPTSGTTVEQATASLTLAGLKWTTGAPLFPGIEMYWAAEFSSMYNLYPKPLNAHKPDTRFRFHNNVLPGDLTKGLSLPWQADFYMYVHSYNITKDLIDFFLFFLSSYRCKLTSSFL